MIKSKKLVISALFITICAVLVVYKVKADEKKHSSPAIQNADIEELENLMRKRIETRLKSIMFGKGKFLGNISLPEIVDYLNNASRGRFSSQWGVEFRISDIDLPDREISYPINLELDEPASLYEALSIVIEKINEQAPVNDPNNKYDYEFVIEPEGVIIREKWMGRKERSNQGMDPTR